MKSADWSGMAVSITALPLLCPWGPPSISQRSRKKTIKNPLKASVYTGGTYLITVVLLVFPYPFLKNYYVCLEFTLTGTVSIIAVFNYYIAFAKDELFRKRFIEMTELSPGVAAFSFFIGFLIRAFPGIDI